jgi:desert hedgehog protein
MFHTIITESGHTLSLTGLHLIPIILNDNTIRYIPAKHVQVGDIVYVMSDNEMIPSSVVNVIIEMKTGFYAPLTTSGKIRLNIVNSIVVFVIVGTLLVNGMLASCYANVQNHEAAHFYMGLLRLYHWIAQSLSISKPFGGQTMDGMHLIPRMMYEFGRFFRPTTLRFT